jgi:hypothetical protein
MRWCDILWVASPYNLHTIPCCSTRTGFSHSDEVETADTYWLASSSTCSPRHTTASSVRWACGSRDWCIWWFCKKNVCKALTCIAHDKWLMERWHFMSLAESIFYSLRVAVWSTQAQCIPQRNRMLCWARYQKNWPVCKAAIQNVNSNARFYQSFRA